MLKRIFFLLIISTAFIFGQPVESLNSSEIKIALKRLNTLGTVLYVAAHPDDENTAFLAYFNYAQHLRSGYFSFTRGDGGQNLIGDEQGDLLSVIRTQELLQARSIDGAEQFFARAVDFGYSKTPDETIEKWGKEEMLSDIVYVIRKFKPDVIVNRFPTSGQGTHGHHTASAILAVEAFNLVGDPNAFPEQLQYVQLWQPKRIFWNAWTPALNSMGINPDTLIKINLGEYNNLLGRSYTEISAESRTMHKSQGFGASGRRENLYNYFFQLQGQSAKNDLFDGIDLNWNRVKGSEKVSKHLKQAEAEFDFENPSKIVPLLVQAYSELQKLNDKYWVDIKSGELLKVIKSCAGIWAEAVTEENLLSPGSETNVKAGFVVRSDVQVTLKSIHIDYQKSDSTLNLKMVKGEMISVERKISISPDAKYSQPYWLEEGNHKDIYIVNDQKLIGQPKTDYPLHATFTVDFNGVEIDFTIPVFYRKNDPVEGEVYKRVEIVPEAVINFDKELYLLKNGEEKEITVVVKSIKGEVNGKLKILHEDGWSVSPFYYDFNFTQQGEEQEFKFKINSTNNNLSANLKAELDIDGKKLSKSLVTTSYPHIQPQTVLPEASAKILKLDFQKKTVKKIAYIMGSGDKIPELLRDLGFSVDVFTKEPLTTELLQNYDVVIAGIRAYNTYQRLSTDQKNILKYVENGGTFIVQYNTTGDLITDPSPFKLKISRDRVTEEDSPVSIINPNHPLMNYPFKITQTDFDGWIQERGLYFPNEWDENFTPLLEMNDNGETPKSGSLLFTKYGKGNYIYTGLSFFRQLPAGVEGAYKLFINLLSAGISE
ncbi:MAG TPA: PIG-L family deacetylase [Ignavibacteriaceae bacterium]|nr:PIG-L family deacetylase [Ignavibacteriaceae bacterium]